MPQLTEHLGRSLASASPPDGQDSIECHSGTLSDGTEFDSSRDRDKPLTFNIGTGAMIKGRDEGVGSIGTMKVGGRRELIVPLPEPELRFGARGMMTMSRTGPIPGGATQRLDVDVGFWLTVVGSWLLIVGTS